MNIESLINGLPRIAAMPWYDPETFQECLALFADRERFFQTHQAWLAKALKDEAKLQAMGHRVVRITIEPKALAQWAQWKFIGLSIYSKHAADFAAHIASNHQLPS